MVIVLLALVIYCIYRFYKKKRINDKAEKNKKNLDNAQEIQPIGSGSAGYSAYANAEVNADRCNPADLSKEYGKGLDIECDFGFKGWYICKIHCENGTPDTEVVSCDSTSKQWDTSNVQCN